MSGLRTAQRGSPYSSRGNTREDWEDWEDDEVTTPFEDGDGPLLSPPAGNSSPRSSPITATRQSIKRLKSRQRQKAQNAKAGIKLVTDMTVLRQQQQQAPSRSNPSRRSRTGRYVDPAALNALEGLPAGDPAWSQKKKQAQPPRNKRLDLLKAEVPSQADVSPISGPIMIGFAMPEGSDVVISPQTAVVETPVDYQKYFKKPVQQAQAPPKASQLPVSVWSPDSDGVVSPESQISRIGPSKLRNQRDTRATSIYISDDEYEVPNSKVTRNRRDTRTTDIMVSDEEDDMDTPVTLFEEDGITPVSSRQKSFRTRGQRRSTLVSRSRSQGWWDQVTSPFGPKSPAKTSSPVVKTPESERSNAWWKEEDRKETAMPRQQNTTASAGRARPPSIIIEHVSARSDSPPRTQMASAQPTPRADKMATLTPRLQTPLTAAAPPPYSPPKNLPLPVRYRAVLPPGHPLATLYPPSPGPVSPGIAGTMTSQGAISLTNVPLTPPAAAVHNPRHIITLPTPPPGTFGPGDHYPDASGRGPRQKAERKRRRHEKEEVAARKVGGLWRGRGCIPESGCFGRSGREGRKRRRVWCFSICGVILGLIILAVVLGVTLTRRSVEATPYSPFLNLTDFPPIPTGVATIVGPNTDGTSVCVQPSTLWSCSLPKERADSAAPFGSDRPTFVFQIQFDNNTRNTWDVTGQQRPLPVPASQTSRPQARGEALGMVPFLRRLIKGRQTGGASSLGFNPEPAPPNFQDMFFLGNTTDNVVSDDKAGEPTPFYISVLESVQDSVGANVLTRRQSETGSGPGKPVNISEFEPPPPVLNPDGTGAPALLYPFAKQQPLRLYDRGLPTERYGFYTYYNKTIYATAVNPPNLNSTDGPSGDENGGALETEAKFLVTFLSARFKVEIWTRRENTTRLMNGGVSNNNATHPGTFPYPTTVTLDTHGGIPGLKFAFSRGVVDRRIVMKDSKFVLNFMDRNGVQINPANKFNPAFGGMDGGNGGCSCKQYSGHPIREQKPRVRPQSLLTLAIETSCDDTCVAIVEKKGGAAKILFNKTITSDSSQYRGIHPVLAVQSHEQNIKTLIEEAKDALPFVKIAPGSPRRGEKRKPNFITVTRGPGMNQSLGIGIDTAKELAFSWGIPILGVHHMQAHALTPRLVDALAREWPAPGEEKLNTTPMPPYPFLTLLVSGGHTQLVLSTSLTSHSVVVDTADVSIGDLLDKCAREILPKKVLSTLNTGSYGAALEKFAWPDAATDPMYDYDCYKVPPKREDEVKPWVSQERGWIVPAPLAGSRELKYNFTGLGGVIRQYAQTLSQYDFSGRQTLARVVMKLAFEHVVGRIIMVLQQYKLTPDGQPKNAAEAPWTAAYAQKQLDMKNKQAHSSQATPSPTPSPTTTTPPPPNPLPAAAAASTDNRIKLILSGGVASNKYLRFILRQWLNARKFPHIRAVAPPLEYCTDNAAMIAWTGFEMFEAGWRTPLESISPTRRWSLDPAIKPTKIGTLKRDEYGVGLMEEGYFVKDEVVKKRGFDDFDDFARKHGFN
ncbi:Glycoprotease family domain containing protein [Rhypophila decipiens]